MPIPDPITIEIDEADLRRALRILGVNIDAALRPPLARSAALLRDFMREYPPPPAPGEWAANTSLAQKRAFFARLRAGEWTGRTGRLMQGWTWEWTQDYGHVLGIKVGNNVEYGPWVQSGQFQVMFHRGRWQTDVEAVDRFGGEIVTDIENSLMDAIQRAGNV